MTNVIGGATNGITLLPCPFCGGEAQAMHMDLDHIEEDWKVWGVWCVDDLNAEDYRSHGHYIDNYATEAEAIEAWNARAERTCHNTWDVELTGRLRFVCSECGGVSLEIAARYCPICGAKVVGE